MLLKFIPILSISIVSSQIYASNSFAETGTTQIEFAPVETPVYVLSDDTLPVTGTYTLGADDKIMIDIFNVPEFSGENGTYTIQSDGSIVVPWLGSVCLLGMTLEEAIDELTYQYQPYVNNPLITIDVIERRPVRVSVVGEVNRPGTYESGVPEADAQLVGDNVVQAIQSADGITQMADIRNVEITRPQYSCPGTVRYTTATIDLWDLLQSGNLAEDLQLRDGDRIMVHTAADLNEAELTEIATANFSPSSININVVGEVDAPGLVELPPNVSLNQAILAAGGFDNRRARRGSVDLIRLNPNGTVTKRNIPVDFAEGLDDENNPPLRNNDIIIVRRSGLASASDTVSTILSPFTTLIGGIGSIFGIVNLFDPGN
jgi:polysaccharide export outer membrane protein